MKRQDIITALRNRNDRSAWNRGVTALALYILDGCEADELSYSSAEKTLLNGARDWERYSWGGCALVYDEDIARTLCTPSELKRTRNGERRPNAREEWLDVQARACAQACRRIQKICAIHAAQKKAR